MDPTKVIKSLVTVRDDHELVVEQLRILTELEGTIAGAGGEHMERVLELIRGISEFFQTMLLPHMEEEEHGMFLFVRDCLPRGSTLIYELEAEHEEMRKLCERLRSELVMLRHERHRKPAVLSDLEQLCSQMAVLLSQHAERETKLVDRYRRWTHGLELEDATGKRGEEKIGDESSTLLSAAR